MLGYCDPSSLWQEYYKFIFTLYTSQCLHIDFFLSIALIQCIFTSVANYTAQKEPVQESDKGKLVLYFYFILRILEVHKHKANINHLFPHAPSKSLRIKTQ